VINLRFGGLGVDIQSLKTAIRYQKSKSKTVLLMILARLQRPLSGSWSVTSDTAIDGPFSKTSKPRNKTALDGLPVRHTSYGISQRCRTLNRHSIAC
jgi:hypothetical protein